MVVDTEFYDRLGVDPSASDAEIKKAYRKMAIQYHPDRNPDADAAEKFKAISEAYEILIDPEKRRLYNQFGKERPQSVGDPMDLFEQLFSYGGSDRRSAAKRTEDSVHEIEVTLEEMYTGKSKKVSFTRSAICKSCNGSGAKKGARSHKCDYCNGRGLKTTIKHVGPGMIQQMQTVCGNCQGHGEMLKDSDKCGECFGKKIVKERRSLDFVIEKGTRDKTRIRFHGESDQMPGAETGDMVFVVIQKQHPVFLRKDNDLYMTKSLTLGEALTGFMFVITHLDGHVLIVEGAQGDIIRPDDIRKISGEGMPKLRDPLCRGDLYITFKVVFPHRSELTKEDVNVLRGIFTTPRIENIPTGENVEQVLLPCENAVPPTSRSNEEEEEDTGSSRTRSSSACHQN